MAKILTFQGKERVASGPSFMTDETETLSFCTSEDGAVSIGPVSRTSLPTLPDPKKDWGNQELADLFRVHQLLKAANVPVDTLRGITDEGDPWFVFCHLNGDVFIHIARLDGLYVLDSPNIRRPLRGRDFHALVADFTNLALPSSSDKDGETEHKVVRLDRGGKISLHPSAMLAALIWTLFLASEELVLLAPKERSENSDDLLDFSDVVATDSDLEAAVLLPRDTTAHNSSEDTRELHQEMMKDGAAESHLARDAMGQQGLVLHQNSFAISLSSIAIAMGFMSEMTLRHNHQKILEGLKAIGLPQFASYTEAAHELSQLADGNGANLWQKLGDFLNISNLSDAEIADANSEVSEDPSVHSGLHQFATDYVLNNAQLLTPKVVPASLHKASRDEISGADLSESQTSEPDMAALLAAMAAQEDSSTINIDNLLGGSTKMQDIQLGKTTVSSSFTISKADEVFLDDYFNSAQRMPTPLTFNERAKAFIDFIQSKDTEIGIIMSGDEIIMIDRSAYTYKGDGAAYYITWEDDSGQTISVIGLKAEFQDFDLIA